MLKDFLTLSALRKGGSSGESTELPDNARVYYVGTAESFLNVSLLSFNTTAYETESD